MGWRDTVQLIIYGIVLIAILSAFYQWPQKYLEFTIKWGTSAIIGVIASGISGELVENFTGDFFKTILIPIPIGDYNFSISAFIIVTAIVRYTLFANI